MISDVLRRATFRFALLVACAFALAACGGRDDADWLHVADPIHGGSYFGDGRDLRALPRWERQLEAAGRRVDALAALSRAIYRPHGAAAMRKLLWRRFLFLLDVGATADDLDAFLKSYPGDPAGGLVRYARAVRSVRAHDYATALQLAPDGTAQAAVAALPAGLADAAAVAAIAHDQHALWQTAANAAPYGLPPLEGEFRYILIDLWSGNQGWEMPYLALFGNWTGAIGVPVAGALPAESFAQNVRDASAIAQAIHLCTIELDPNDDSPWLREHALYRIVALLYRQDRTHPSDETAAMESIVTGQTTPRPGAYHAWYAMQADATARALAAQFPASPLAAEALRDAAQMR